ncbi:MULTISPECIES: M24 family metallopeptidase [Pontibacillus]|uniref:Xaa-Pro peptidase family protein n=1 Tax=Pontibacillus chungwhensis TaxID=265426 RepID=A0ABY8UYD6_9BACI|nr:Xaa-Pro peptidase family protein [Pontibacillus chungwhensis]MCD5324170.1 Xaa-Pro peptidase family protein [Pontibacillus sp. HN14]WIF97771.1 Xaa-Pro peptidase family protein [Pontibacillus chungwhensis]
MDNIRIQALRQKMKETGVSAVWLTSPENRFYFSQFKGSSGSLFITEEETILLTDFRYVDQAHDEAPSFTIVDHKRKEVEEVARLLNKHSCSNVGIELVTLPTQSYLEVTKRLPEVSFQGFDDELNDIRMIKDESEIHSLHKAIEICDKAFDHITTFIQPGITEKEIGLELETFMRKAGAESIKTNHVIASGERSSLPHGQATDRVIQKGDFVKMDIGARVNGYYSDFTRTVVLGEPSDKQKDIYSIVRETQEASLEAIGPGRTCSEIDQIGRGIIESYGYGEHFGHSLGHSIGLALHEKPVMRATDDTVLQPGMVITVEPGIYLKGFGGVRIEDLVVITEKGHNNLTQATKDLIVIPV